MRWLFLLIPLFSVSNSLKIIVYNPTFSHSHHKFSGILAETLAEAGHQVVELAPLPNPENLRNSKLTRIITMPQFTWSNEEEKIENENRKIALWTSTPSPFGLYRTREGLGNFFTRQCEHNLKQKDILENLRREKFDLGITEMFDFCGHGLFHFIGVNVTISTASCMLMDHQANIIGVPRVPSYVPGSLIGLPERMSFFQRLISFVSTYFADEAFLVVPDKQTKMFRENVDANFPDLRELAAASPLVFTNTIPILSFPHPTLDKVIDIGGIALPKRNHLNKEWDEILSRNSKNVLISFGTVVKAKDMPEHLKSSVLRMISNLPNVNFIWKHTGEIKDKPSNLYLIEWMPQSDLLVDPRLSIFITHGGLASCHEIAASGIPSIIIPIFGDQPKNGVMMERHNSSIVLSKFDLADSEKLTSTVKTLIRDKKYRENAQRISKLIAGSMFDPKDIFLRGVDYVGRFGPLPQLDPYGRHLSFIQYYLLDVVLFLLISISFLIISVVYVIHKSVHFVRTMKSKSKKE